MVGQPLKLILFFTQKWDVPPKVHPTNYTTSMLFPTLALPKSGTVETSVSSQPVHKLPTKLIFLLYYAVVSLLTSFRIQMIISSG